MAIASKTITFEDPFAHLYHLLCIKLGHISGSDDFIGIQFGVCKNDQEGEFSFWIKRMYSNPMEPNLCIFLALGVYLASNNLEGNKLFPGSNQATRFSTILMNLLEKNDGAQKLRQSGLNTCSDIGSHSYRKGAKSYVLNGSTAPP